MKKFKTNDKVLITAGKHKGKTGKITKIFPQTQKVLVEGVNVYKKHLKPRQTGGQGQIVDRQRPIHTASIALICPQCKKPTRASKKRLCTKCNKPITIKSIKKK